MEQLGPAVGDEVYGEGGAAIVAGAVVVGMQRVEGLVECQLAGGLVAELASLLQQPEFLEVLLEAQLAYLINEDFLVYFLVMIELQIGLDFNIINITKQDAMSLVHASWRAQSAEPIPELLELLGVLSLVLCIRWTQKHELRQGAWGIAHGSCFALLCISCVLRELGASVLGAHEVHDLCARSFLLTRCVGKKLG